MNSTDFEVTSMKNFDSPHSDLSDIKRIKIMFKNGFGASIISGKGTYSSESHPYELAVIDSKGSIRYDTTITDDVIGYLNESEVKKILFEISGLMPENMQLQNM